MKTLLLSSAIVANALALPVWAADIPSVTPPLTQHEYMHLHPFPEADSQMALMPDRDMQDDHSGYPMSPEPETTSTEVHPGHHMKPLELNEETLTPQALIQLNMRRDASGTGWQPMDNPMQMKMGQVGPWTTMLHWNAFLDYDNQGGSRGDEGIFSQNWIMAGAARPVGEKGVFQSRLMMSLDPLTVTPHGYPVLFQTGETYHGQPLIDRQHPHDLFMEISTQYYHRLQNNTWLRLYAAPVGEPALGPVAFPHRYSALFNPESVLSHHMQDSTHIAFGVLTAGLIQKNWQVEGSLFNAKEPDENRYDFDYDGSLGYAGRVSYMPNKNWALQASYGYLNDPEALDPGDIERLTGSAQHIKTWMDGWWATTFVFGHNFAHIGPDENGVTLESLVNFKTRNYVYGRIENVVKHGLFAPGDSAGDDEETFTITAFTLGMARDLFRIRDIPLTLGAQLTAYAKPSSLNATYGDFPVSFHIYLHTNAPGMRMTAH